MRPARTMPVAAAAMPLQLPPLSTAFNSANKVHSTSVCVIPPRSVWRQLQAIRTRYDKSYVRWPPHINLLYPFLADNIANGQASAAAGGAGDAATDPFHQYAVRAGLALAHVRPFKVRLARLRTFHHARSITAWLDPEPVVPGPTRLGQEAIAPSALLQPSSSSPPTPPRQKVAKGTGSAPEAAAGHVEVMAGASAAAPRAPYGTEAGHVVAGDGGGLVGVQRLLTAAFPICTDLSRDPERGIDGFVPHLSLGQIRDEGELEELQAAWEPLEFWVDSVQLISRQGYLSPFTVRYHVPLGLGLGPEPGPGRAGLAAALLSQQEQHGQGQPQKEQRQQPSAGLPGVDRKVALAGPSPPAPGSPVPRLPSPAQAGLADPAVSALEAAVAAGVVRLDVPYIATLGPMQARNGTTGGAGVGLPPAPARDSGRPAGGLEDVGGAGDSQAAAAAVAGHSRAAVTERFGAPCWVPWAGGGGTHGARSVPIAQQQQAQQAGEPAVHCASATCAEEAGQQAGTGEGQGPPAKRHHAATEPLTSEHDSATANQGRIPAGAGAEDATSPGHLGGAVWWFAYGAAVGATAEQLGALRSVPAVLPGYRLAFNRPGGRANIVPLEGEAARKDRRSNQGLAAGADGGGEDARVAAGSTATAAAESQGVAAMEVPAAVAAAVAAAAVEVPAATAAAVPPAVHGVAHLLPLERAARLLLLQHESGIHEVVCKPYPGSEDTGEPAASDEARGDLQGGVGGPGAAQQLATPAAAVPGLIPAVAFAALLERCLAQEVPPPHRYMEVVRQAYGKYETDPLFRCWLDGICTAVEGTEDGMPYKAGAGGAVLRAWRNRRTGADKAAADGLGRLVGA